MRSPSQPRFVIVGAGMSGIATATRLLQEGYEHVTLIEKADDYGGTWRDNVYPGVACDVPSALYSYSFAPNAEWSRIFAPGSEIHRYLGSVAESNDLRRLTKFGVSVVASRWDSDHWDITLSDDTKMVADVLIAATGVLREPTIPSIPGMDSFEGKHFHSARWDPSTIIDGARVAVIGTGSTGVQLVNSIAGRASHLTVLQRTPQWIFPAPNLNFSKSLRALMRNLPGIGQLIRRLSDFMALRIVGVATVKHGLRRRLVQGACRRNLKSVKDPALRRSLTPDDQPMCRRMVMAGGFYKTVQRDDVDVVTDAIKRVEPDGVRTADGRLHKVDVIILATGFDAHRFIRPLELTGLEGRTIDEEWANGARAYRTVALPSFPNFFMLIGPYSPFGNQSQISVAETQIEYIIQWLRARHHAQWTAAAPSREATDRFNQEIDDALSVPGTVWTTGCTKAWYQGDDGLPQLWPWHSDRHGAMLERPQLDEWEGVA